MENYSKDASGLLEVFSFKIFQQVARVAKLTVDISVVINYKGWKGTPYCAWVWKSIQST